MKKIRDLRFFKGATSLLVAGTLACTLASCSGKVNMKNLSPKELLSISDVKDLTLVDELIEAGELRLFGEDIDVITAAEKLEHYLDIIDDLAKVDFSGVSLLTPLSEEQCNVALALSDTDIEMLKEECKYNGKDVCKLEKKLTALKMLSFLKTACLDWVHHNGQNVCLKYMMAAVKGAVADEFGVSVNDYSTIKINERPGSATDTELDYTITVGGSTYRVPSSVGELWNTIHYIYSVQEAELTDKTEFETYRKALNYGKTTMAAGVNVKKDKLVEQNSESYIKRNYVNR